MKFKVSVEKLLYRLQRVMSGLGGGGSAFNYYFFTVEDNFVDITCTDGDIFAKVQTEITPEDAKIHNFDVNVTALHGLLSLAETEEISFDCDGTRVEIKCGDYSGSWLAKGSVHRVDFPAFSTEQPVSLEDQGASFVDAIGRVKHAAMHRMVFQNGFCYAGDLLRYQEVNNVLPPEISFAFLPTAFNVVKFLRMNPVFRLGFAESEKHLFFYDGGDVFVVPKHENNEKLKTEKGAEKDDWDKRELTGKQSYFTVDIAALSKVIMRASLTCEENSLSLLFKIEEDKLTVFGNDSRGNHGEESVAISLQGSKTVIKRKAGWNFFVAALTASGEKAVTIYFDKHVGIVKTDKIRGGFSLMSEYGV